MGDNTSIKDFSEYLKKLTSVSDTYIMYHDSKEKLDRRTASVQKLEEAVGINKANANTKLNEIKEAAKFRENKTDIYIDAGEVFV